MPGWVRCGWWPPAWPRPAAVKRAAFMAFGVAGGGRPGAGLGHLVVDAAGGGGLPGRRVVLHRRAPSLRLRRSGRGVRLRLLRPGGHGRHLLRRRPCGWRAGGGLGGRRRWSACWPPRSSWPTTCGTSPPTPVRASGPLAVRVGRRAGGWFYVACVGLPFLGVVVWGVLAVTGAVARRPAGASPSCRWWPCRWPWLRSVWCSARPRDGTCSRCWPPPGDCSWSSGCSGRGPVAVDPGLPAAGAAGERGSRLSRSSAWPGGSRTRRATSSGRCRWGAWPAPGHHPWARWRRWHRPGDDPGR